MEYALRGIRNVLIELDMVEGTPQPSAQQVIISKTKWLRAEMGGFLQFHVAPGDLVEKDQPISTNTTLLGLEQTTVRAPRAGLVLGLTTLPSVAPGDPICHLGLLDRKAAALQKAQSRSGTLMEQARLDLATNVHVTEHEELPEEDPA